MDKEQERLVLLLSSMISARKAFRAASAAFRAAPSPDERLEALYEKNAAHDAYITAASKYDEMMTHWMTH